MGGRGAGGGGKGGGGGGGGGINPDTGKPMASSAEISKIQAQVDQVKNQGWDKYGGNIEAAAKKYGTNSPQYHKARAPHTAWMKKNYQPLVKKLNKAKGTPTTDFRSIKTIRLT